MWVHSMISFIPFLHVVSFVSVFSLVSVLWYHVSFVSVVSFVFDSFIRFDIVVSILFHSFRYCFIRFDIASFVLIVSFISV